VLGSLRASLSARSYSAFNHPRFGTLYGAHVLKGDGGFESGLLQRRAHQTSPATLQTTRLQSTELDRLSTLS